MRQAYAWVFGLGLLVACSPEASNSPDELEPATDAAAGRAMVAQGREFMVAAPTEQAMEAGRSILEQGGNAVDAAAATAFALMVTDPLMASVGGRSQILIRLADGTFVGIDGATQAPARLGDPARIGHGYGTVPIPGSPAALAEMLEEYGTLSLEEVLQPAIRIAEEGFPVLPDLAENLLTSADRLTLYPGTRAYFYKEDGSPYSEGEVLKQPALARTLQTLAREGADALYRGSLASAFVADMEENGGLVTRSDLAQYRPIVGEVVRGEYRGRDIVARGGNCDGASVIEMLQILEHFDLGGYDIQDPEYVHIIAQTLRLGSEDEYVPDSIQVSSSYAAQRAQEIDLAHVYSDAMSGGSGPEGDTNHLSVVDAAGNAVAITQSIGPNFGSKVASPGLGFFYAYSYDMNDDPVPLQREKTSQSPTMVLADSQPFLVLGSAGSGRIPGSIVRVVVNVVDHGMTLGDALAARRWFMAEDELRIEATGLPVETLEALEGFGYSLALYEGMDGYFARVHAVMRDPSTGTLWGASDPRDFGAAGGR